MQKIPVGTSSIAIVQHDDNFYTGPVTILPQLPFWEKYKELGIRAIITVKPAPSGFPTFCKENGIMLIPSAWLFRRSNSLNDPAKWIGMKAWSLVSSGKKTVVCCDSGAYAGSFVSHYYTEAKAGRIKLPLKHISPRRKLTALDKGKAKSLVTLGRVNRWLKK
ncbi:MAG TPA: hypothetical protein VJH23_00320 [archaeon]|nr:hypothetical protein [archaeon]